MSVLDSGPSAQRKNEIHSTGITELYVPESPVVDICFVHGFTGHPARTWTANRPGKRQAPGNTPEHTKKRRITSSFLQKLNPNRGETSNTAIVHSDLGPTFWPRDLIPQIIPNGRVLTFGYDTHIRHKFVGQPSRNRLKDHAEDFLVALEDCRISDPKRPLIFIAHSLGGLLVKDTLRISKDYIEDRPERASIYTSTASLAFFGTPHGGADPLGTAHETIINLSKALGFQVNKEIVRLLMPASERLELLRDEFQRMVHDQNWHIYTFQEEFAQSGLSCKVVEDSSSCINDRCHERVVHIKANHVDMCRFSGYHDPEFRAVEAALRRMITEDVLSRSETSSQTSIDNQPQNVLIPTEKPAMTKKERDSLLEKLSFENIDARYLTLKTAQKKTCAWLPKRDLYKSWKDFAQQGEHHGFLWIKGKPGTGKSVMMKYLLQHERRSKTNDIIISFFFNARGSILERTTEGLYRSLLFQLLRAIPNQEIDYESLRPLQLLSENKPWPLEGLKEAFGSIIEQLGSCRVVCFIDALDECPEDQVRDMIYFFEDIGEKAVEAASNVRVCFSSRHYPHITIRKGLQLILEDQSDHSEDIQMYIESKLKVGEHERQEISEEILQRSSDIFLWAALVVNILNKEYDKGGRINVRKRLRQIPTGLHELFHDILTRDQRDLNKLVLCLQWILFANRPLRPEELYFAMQLNLESKFGSYWDREQIPIDQINRFNLQVSKGLTEVTKAKLGRSETRASKDTTKFGASKATIQFIHESVRDYLLVEGGLQAIIEQQLGIGTNIVGISHDILKKTCVQQLQESVDLHITIPDPLPKANSAEAAKLREEAETKFPFLNYAVHNVLGHSNSAQEAGSDQQEFISTFPKESWIKLANLLQKHEIRRYSIQTHLLYLLAEGNFDKLIDQHPSENGDFLLHSNEKFRYPLVVAMALGHKEAVRSLVLHDVEGILLDRPDKKDRMNRILEDLSAWSTLNSGSSSVAFKGKHMWDCICHLKSYTLLETYLLRHSGPKTMRQISPSVVATVPQPMFKLFIRQGLGINSPKTGGFTLLHHAVRINDIEKVKCLLEEGVNLYIDQHNSPISYALSNRMTRLLLLHEAKYDYSPNSNCSPRTYIWGYSDSVLRKRQSLGEYVDPISVLTDLILEDASPLNATHNTLRFWLFKASEAHMHPRSGELVRLILNAGNVQEFFTTPYKEAILDRAINQPNNEVVKAICMSELIDLNASTVNSKAMLWRAAEYPIFSISSAARGTVVQTLLDHGALPTITDDHGLTLPAISIITGHVEITKVFLADSRTDITALCDRERSLTSYAAEHNTSILKTLLERGCLDPDKPDVNGRTPFMYACKSLQHERIELLLQHGRPDINSPDNYGVTPLWHALLTVKSCVETFSFSGVYQGWGKVFRLLLSNGVDPLIEKDGLRPVDFMKELRDNGMIPRYHNVEDVDEVISLLSSYTEG
ncbi:ankyrin [Camillea tinctor]|nr:ankyrin [Camillea tinctor]